MGKLQDCIGLVKASHNLSDEDVNAIVAATEDGMSASEAVDSVTKGLEVYRGELVSQIEEAYPELKGEAPKPVKPKEPKKREATDAQKKKATSRIFNASYRILAADANVQQFANANVGDLQTFVQASETYLENYLADRKEAAKTNNDIAEIAALNDIILDGGKATIDVFNSDYFRTLQGKARRAFEKAEKERKLAEFKDAARTALRTKKWEGIALAQVRSFVRGWHQALNKKPVSNLKDQSAYANAGFREAKALMQEYNITAGKQDKFIGSGGRLRRMHEMLEKDKIDTERTDEQFINSIYRIANRSSILSHDLIHPEAPGGVHRVLDEIRDKVKTFKMWRGAKDGGGHSSWTDSFSEATLRHIKGAPERRAGIEADARNYVDTLAKIAAVFEENKSDSVEELMKGLAEVYGDRKEGDDTFVSPEFNSLNGYLNWIGRAHRRLIKGERDAESYYQNKLIDEQHNPYIPPARTKPLVRKKLESIIRTGFPLHRDGKSVTADMMQGDLGFSEVFAGINGNVQEHMNYGYDALMDLAQLAELDPAQIGLNELWFGVGALGQGGRTAAHFSPSWPLPSNEGDIPTGYNAGDTVPHIHLTATSGDGTVAHEWTHALDWALQKQSAESRALVQALYDALKRPYKSRADIDRAMREIYNEAYLYGAEIHPDALKKYPGTSRADRSAQAAYSYLLYQQQEEKPYRFIRNNDPRGSSSFYSEALLLDDGSNKVYWSKPTELMARTGEAYYYDSIIGQGKSSDYLVSSWVADGTLNKDNGYKGKPYATGDERKILNAVFESFLAAIDWSGAVPKVKDDWTPEIGLSDKQSFDVEVKSLLESFEQFETEKRKEWEEAEAKAKAAEEEALSGARDDEIGMLEGLIEEEDIDIAEEQVEQESEPLIEDMDINEIEGLLDEMDATIEEAAQEDHDKADQPVEESVGELLNEVGEHGTQALKDALTGLSELFGTKGKLNSFPPGFDPESYAKAKPYFASALHELVQAGYSAKKAILKLKELFPMAIKYLSYYLTVDYKQSQLHKRSFAQYLYEQFKAGSAPTNNAQLKRMLSLQKGKPVDEITQYEMKDAQEAIEVAVVKVARDIVAGKGTVEQKFNSLVDLYQKQPLLNITTTTSGVEQAYSTPVPLAYLVSLAAEANTGRVFEPTAGNGALLINTAPENGIANEINEERANNLRGLGFTVDGRDALNYVETGWIKTKVDSIVTNPPFGALHDEGRANVELRTGYKIEKIDQAIVAESLRALKDDGKASIIIGANKEPGVISNQDRVFFNWLYSNYNVTDHFEVDGALYQRQGAGWPVRFITIEGRKDDDASVSPVTGDIERLSDWSTIYERTTGSKLGAGMAPDVGGPTAGAGDGGGSAAPAGGPTDELGTAQEPAAGETGDVGGAGTGTGVGEPAGAGGGGTGRAEPGLDGGAGTGPTGDNAGLGAGEGAAEAGPGATGTDTGSGVPRGGKRAGKRLDEFQSKYTSFSESPADDTLRVPANLAQAITDSLNKVQSEIGSFDDFLMDRLAYKTKAALHTALSAHQIDAVVMAIYQIERGKALIIGDQTGVGKGRQAAAIIRYAKLQGKTPIFFTAKKALYTDMHRDLNGIDEKHNPWVTNNSYGVSSFDKQGKAVTLFSQSDNKQKENMDHILKTGTLPAGMDMVFSAYSQIQNVASEKRRAALLALAPNSIMILDESHESAGQSERGNFMTNMLELSSGATYLSGTYSKRPDTMPIYFKTDMFDAVDSNADLVDAMTAGGEPLQQAVSHMLAKSGQLITRQRTFEGIKMETKVIGEPMPGDDAISEAEQLEADNQVASSDETTAVLRMVHAADESFTKVAVPSLESQANQQGGAMVAAGSKASKITVSHSPFTSTIFNVTRQMLLAIKVNAIADQAISAHRRGEKPIIALSSTIEAMHTEFVQQHGIKAGDDISMLTYKDVLKRSLRKVRRVKYTDRKGKREWYDTVPISQLPPQTQAVFLAAEAKIDAMPDQIIDGMPASPLDWITHRLEKEGITVGELTGRGVKIVYDGKGGAVFEKKTKEEKDAVAVARRFNDKKAQALILNISGSTGISLHAAQEFGDHAIRHMIIAQPELDINIYVQILGRINRFKQLKKPIYTSVTTSIPAELRLLSMLYAKLKKLNANVSSDTKSNTQIEAPDILNKYGDRIVAEWADENQVMIDHFSQLLQGVTGTGSEVQAGAASKTTGRIGMLPVMDQRAFYDDVVPAYEAYIEELTARGENDLITEMLDYDAIETDSEVIIEGKDPASEFGQDTVWGNYSIKRQGKPPTAQDVAKRLIKSQKRPDGSTMTGEEYIKHYVTELKASLTDEIEAAEKRVEAIEKQIEPILDQNLKKDDPKMLAIKDVQHEAVMLTGSIARANQSEATLLRNLQSLGFGKPLQFTDNDGVRMQGVVVEIKSKLAKPSLSTNPMAPSRISVVVMVNNGKRELPFTLSKFHSENDPRGIWGSTMKELFKEQDLDARERQQIITGNLIAGLTEENVAKKGRIINYTTHEGTEEIGIRLAPSFDRGSMLSGNYPMRSAEDIVDFVLANKEDRNLTATGVRSGVGVLIYPDYDGIKIWVPGAANMKKSWWGNPQITEYTGDFVDASGTGSSKRKTAVVSDRDNQVKAVRELMKKAAFFVTKSMATKAKEFVDGRQDMEQVGDEVAESISREEAQDVLAGLNLPADIQSKVTIKVNPDKASKARGRFSPTRGTVEIFYDRIPNTEEALKTIRHEVFAHWGLRELFGDDLVQILNRVHFATRTNKEIRAIYDAVRKLYPSLTEGALAEEVIAKISEEQVDVSALQATWNYIKGLLRKMGLISNDISVSEIQELIKKSAKNIQRPGGTRKFKKPLPETVKRQSGLPEGAYKAAGTIPEMMKPQSGLPDEYFEQRYDNDEQRAMAAKVGNIYDERSIPQKIKDSWNNDIRPRLWKKIEQGIVDRYASIRDLDVHSWKLARMSHTASGVVEHLFKHGRVMVNEEGGISSRADESLGQGLAEILAPLGEEVDRFFNWMIANRAEGLMAEGRENWLSDEDIAAGMSMNQGETENGELREELYEATRNQFIGLHEHVIDIAQELGVINTDERATWEQEFYVPFYRVLEGEKEAGGPKMLDGLTGQTAYKRLKGAERQIGDPMSNVLQNWHHIMSAGMKNKAAQETVKAGLAMGIMEEVPAHAKPKGAFFIREEGTVTDEMGDEREVQGMKKWYVSHDDVVLDAISALNLNDINFPGMKTIGFAKRIFTAGVTMNPEFMIANLIRDSIHSAAVTPTGKNPFMNVIKGIDLTKKGSRVERQMLAGGGALHFGLMYADDPAGAKLLIKKHIEEDTIISDEAGLTHLFKGGINKWMELGSRVENINRTALYDKLKSEGLSDFEANFQARDLLDFSQGGAHVLVRFLTQAVPFLNARLQGLHKVGRSWNDPQQRAQFIAVMGAYLTAAMGLFLMYKDDEDFKKREEWDKDSYHWFKIGDTAYRIPRPFEIGVAATVAERMWDTAMNDEASAELFGERMLHAIGQTFEFDPVPQLMRPLWNVATDVDPFTKRRIEGESLRGLPPEERRRLWTSETSIALSKGMSKVMWKKATLSPIQIEYMIKGYTGWVGATALGITDMAVSGVMGNPSRPAPRFPADMPVIGRFARDLPEPHTKYMSRFYEQNAEIKEIYNMFKEYKKRGDKAGAKALAKEYKGELKFKKAYGKVERALSKVNAEIMRIRMSSMDRDVKKRKIDKLTQKKNELAEKIVSKHGY